MKKSCFIIFLTTCVFTIPANIQAQSLKDLFNKDNITNAISTIARGDNTDFIGTWNYTGSAIDFKSENLLQKAGGAVAAAQIKSKMDEQLKKAGIKPEDIDITFHEDNKFTGMLNNQKLEGTYSYNPETEMANFIFAKLLTLNAQVSYKSSAMSLLFDADKLLLLLTYLGQQSENETINALSALAGSYDGMLVGLELKKK